MSQADDLTLGIRRVGAAGRFPDGSLDARIETTRGVIPAVFHLVEGSSAAVIWVSGAIGGFNGPTGLYPSAARRLARRGVSSLRISYRRPNELDECVLDTLAAGSVLKGLGAADLAVVGHSFGGAVAILAGTLHPMIRAVIALSSQTYGTQTVADLSPRPLYLLHGLADTRLPPEASRDIYARARDPKEIVLLPDAGHALAESPDEVRRQVLAWIAGAFGLPGEDAPPPALDPRPVTVPAGGRRVRLRLTTTDLFDLPVDAAVCSTNDHLLPDGALGERLLVRTGGALAAGRLAHPLPLALGSAVPVDLPGLACRTVIWAVIARADDPFQPVPEATVAQAIGAALRAAADRGARSVGVPPIGTGGGGLAQEVAARAALTAIAAHLDTPTTIEAIELTVPGAEIAGIYREAIGAAWGDRLLPDLD